MAGKIAYRFKTPAYPDNILYVNIITDYACVNDCLFCSRPRTREEFGTPNIYEKKAGTSLHLQGAPSVDQIMAEIEKEIQQDDKELAFVGLGEPLMYLNTVVDVLQRVKQAYIVKTRVDTNGLAKCTHKNPAQTLAGAGLDEIRISLNAVSEAEYNQLCRPKFKNAFSNLLSFIQDCLASTIDTKVSFVTGLPVGFPARPVREYIDFAISLGVVPEDVILRQYVPPVV